jgi:hypothetical protein
MSGVPMQAERVRAKDVRSLFTRKVPPCGMMRECCLIRRGAADRFEEVHKEN